MYVHMFVSKCVFMCCMCVLCLYFFTCMCESSACVVFVCIFCLYVCECVFVRVSVCVHLFQEQWEEPGESGGPCSLWALPGTPRLTLSRTLCESHFSPVKPHKVADLLHVGDKHWHVAHVW